MKVQYIYNTWQYSLTNPPPSPWVQKLKKAPVIIRGKGISFE